MTNGAERGRSRKDGRAASAGVLKVAGGLCCVAAIGLGLLGLTQGRWGTADFGETLSAIDAQIPVSHADRSGGQGSGVAVNVGEYDYVGVLEIIPQGRRLPVLSQALAEHYDEAPALNAGSAKSGNLVIVGSEKAGQLDCLGQLRDGDEATFTDVKGSVFSYRLATVETVEADATGELYAKTDLTLAVPSYSGREYVAYRFNEK